MLRKLLFVGFSFSSFRRKINILVVLQLMNVTLVVMTISNDFNLNIWSRRCHSGHWMVSRICSMHASITSLTHFASQTCQFGHQLVPQLVFRSIEIVKYFDFRHYCNLDLHSRNKNWLMETKTFYSKSDYAAVKQMRSNVMPHRQSSPDCNMRNNGESFDDDSPWQK